MFAVVMTCERPDGVSYVTKTRLQLRDAGWRPFTTVHDGGGGCGYEGRLGIVPTFKRAVSYCLHTGDVGPFVIFQDDIELPDDTDLREVVLRCLPAERGVFSLYLTEGREAPQGWSTIDNSDTYPLNVGACGIVMDAETARLFVESPPFPRVDRLGSQLVLWCWERGIPFWVHSPSLLKHIGVVSTR